MARITVNNFRPKELSWNYIYAGGVSRWWTQSPGFLTANSIPVKCPRDGRRCSVVLQRRRVVVWQGDLVDPLRGRALSVAQGEHPWCVHLSSWSSPKHVELDQRWRFYPVRIRCPPERMWSIYGDFLAEKEDCTSALLWQAKRNATTPIRCAFTFFWHFLGNRFLRVAVLLQIVFTNQISNAWDTNHTNHLAMKVLELEKNLFFNFQKQDWFLSNW